MIGIDAVLLPAVSVHAVTATAMDTVREVHVATTTTTGLGTDRLLVVAALWKSTQCLLVAMTTRTAETTLPPIHI